MTDIQQTCPVCRHGKRFVEVHKVNQLGIQMRIEDDEFLWWQCCVCGSIVEFREDGPILHPKGSGPKVKVNDQ